MKCYIRPEKKAPTKFIKLLCIVLAFLLLATFLFYICSRVYIRRLLNDFPLNLATTKLYYMINTAMKESYQSSFVAVDQVEYDSLGKVKAIETNTYMLNSVKINVIEQLRKMSQTEDNELSFSLPLGTIIGNEYTLGLGPKVHFKLRFSDTFNCKYSASFEQAGINNTLHRIKMQVEGNIYIVVPWCYCSKAITTDYVLAETVIVGDVPEAYTNVKDNSGDVVGDIFDYGAEIEDKGMTQNGTAGKTTN